VGRGRSRPQLRRGAGTVRQRHEEPPLQHCTRRPRPRRGAGAGRHPARPQEPGPPPHAPGRHPMRRRRPPQAIHTVDKGLAEVDADHLLVLPRHLKRRAPDGAAQVERAAARRAGARRRGEHQVAALLGEVRGGRQDARLRRKLLQRLVHGAEVLRGGARGDGARVGPGDLAANAARRRPRGPPGGRTSARYWHMSASVS
jgi:hypothetical protein